MDKSITKFDLFLQVQVPDKRFHFSYPELINMLWSLYKGPVWGNLNLFPGMGDEQTLRLSEVYTQLEMESYHGRDRKRVAIPVE